jgi:8-oxo-dGTP pyrophosphatase MutT (NUDIX family)
MQVAALPIRNKNGQLQVLLVTTRASGAWIIPKGGRSRKLDDAAAAAREAREEAGVVGRVKSPPVGKYRHQRRGGSHEVAVYELHVSSQRREWPECRIRKRRWVTVVEACNLTSQPGLRNLLLSTLG